MGKKTISARSLERINMQLHAEEAILDEIQTVLAEMNRFETVDALLFNSAQQQQDLEGLLTKIPQLRVDRKQLRNDIAHELLPGPHLATLQELTRFAASKEARSEPGFSDLEFEVLQKKVARTSGRLNATVSNLLLKRQIVETSLAALGVMSDAERYNAAGEKVNQIATSAEQS